MSELKVVVWNCGGLRAATSSTSQKMLFFENEIKNDFHLAIFLETHQKPDEQPPPEILRYQQSHHIIEEAVNDRETHTGITILLHDDYELLSFSAPLPGRVLNIQIEHKLLKEQYNVIAIYNYTLAALTDDKVTLLTTAIKSVTHPTFKNILTGDFNFAETDSDRATARSYPDLAVSRLWGAEMAELDFVDPFRQKNPKRKMWSYVSPHKTGSRIDRLYVNEDTVPHVIKYRHIPVPFNGAHRILSFSIKHHIPRGPSYWKMNTSILSDRAYRQEMDTLMTEMGLLGITDGIRWWQLFISCVRCVSISYSDQKNKVKRDLRNRLLSDLRALEEDPAQCKLLHANDSYAYLLRQLKTLQMGDIEGYKRRTKYVSKYDDTEHEIAFYAKVEVRQASKDTISELAESADSQKYSDTDNMMNLVTKYYTDLSRTRDTDIAIQNKVLTNITSKLSDVQKTTLDADVTLEELAKAVTEMQTKKSPGLDGIPIEFYQHYWCNNYFL